ncbi:phosphoribosyltransferase family protein [Portibacter lacus]|uniref:Bifunctional protein PyrR n=1 Tax=Portibacter lacus TaxID=1099794 RepID=A0AA37SU82_9BACT|nr:phosphoribosyltransferase family protein [Portibacter lacus]GLR18303.1 bifunctional protein PyrR [Portibacter lacus]
MNVLDNVQVQQKIKRVAIEILEYNFDEKEIILLGMNNNGYTLAELLKAEMALIYPNPISIRRITLDPKYPNKEEAIIEEGVQNLKGKVIIIIDDVANTGRSLFYAFKPLLNILPKRVQVMVLVNRKHKSFPVKVDYMGLELATTVKEHIKVDIKNKGNYSVDLE